MDFNYINHERVHIERSVPTSHCRQRNLLLLLTLLSEQNEEAEKEHLFLLLGFNCKYHPSNENKTSINLNNCNCYVAYCSALGARCVYDLDSKCMLFIHIISCYGFCFFFKLQSNKWTFLFYSFWDRVCARNAKNYFNLLKVGSRREKLFPTLSFSLYVSSSFISLLKSEVRFESNPTAIMKNMSEMHFQKVSSTTVGKFSNSVAHHWITWTEKCFD